MHEPDDRHLLREFVEGNSEAAFSDLARRHIDLVYSVALRISGNAQAAEDVTQAVFIILARKARALLRHPSLSGWLYQTTRLTTANYLRAETRRMHREQEAYMHSIMDQSAQDSETWASMAPLLEEAMGHLGQADRDAVVLRFFENQSIREVSLALRVSEDAAKMRLSRSVEKLREYFLKRGLKVSAPLIISTLSSNAVQAAPATLLSSAQAVALKRAQAGARVLAAAAAAGPAFSISKATLMTVLGIGTVAGAVVIGATLLQHWPSEHPTTPTDTRRSEVAKAEPDPILREPLTTNFFACLNTPVGSVALQPDGKIVFGATLGGFAVDEQSRAMGWFTRGAIRLNPDGSLDRTFYCNVGRPGVSSAMASQVAMLGADRILLSGTFESVDEKPMLGHAVLLPDGRLDESFDPWAGDVKPSNRIDSSRLSYSSAVLSDGGIAVMSRPIDSERTGSSWAAYRLDSRGNIVGPPPSDIRRPPKLILAFSDMPLGPFPEVPLELIRYTARLPDGGAVLPTRDRPINGMMRYGSFKRFDKDWNLDPTFTNWFEIMAQSEVSVHPQPDGKLLVAGLVGQLNGEDFPGLVRLDRTGAIDRTFRCATTNALEGRIMDVAIQPDGRIVICGFFTEVNGMPRAHIARLNADGSLDESFEPPFLTMREFNDKRFAQYQLLAKSRSKPGTADSGSRVEAIGAPLQATITSLTFENNAAVVRASGKPLQAYALEAAETLGTTNWIEVTTTRSSSDGTAVLRDPDAAKLPTRFYRVTPR